MKIFCVGKNYADHAREMGGEAPEKPLIFMKPSTALLTENKPFYLPEFSREIHYECEWVLRIAKKGKSIEERFARRYVDAMALGIDFTARDLQATLKAAGHAWEISKAFDHSAVVSEFIPLEARHLNAGVNFHLMKNDKLVQKGHSHQMIHSVESLLAYISHFFTLHKGDYIFTGTPAGVGPVDRGDRLSGWLNEEEMFRFEIK